MTDKSDRIRAAFQRWVIRDNFLPTVIQRITERKHPHQVNDREDYYNLHTDMMWGAWQAAYAQGRADLIASMEPEVYMTLNEEDDPAMLFFDRSEAKHYCDDGEEPIALSIIPKE
jgi:hypothetical protein